MNRQCVCGGDIPANSGRSTCDSEIHDDFENSQDLDHEREFEFEQNSQNQDQDDED